MHLWSKQESAASPKEDCLVDCLDNWWMRVLLFAFILLGEGRIGSLELFVEFAGTKPYKWCGAVLIFLKWWPIVWLPMCLLVLPALVLLLWWELFDFEEFSKLKDANLEFTKSFKSFEPKKTLYVCFIFIITILTKWILYTSFKNFWSNHQNTATISILWCFLFHWGDNYSNWNILRKPFYLCVLPLI